MKRSGRGDGAGKGEPVQRISAATKPLSADIQARQRRYLISMAVRTACFLGCVVAFVVLDQPVIGWILLIGALLLPYVAVVVANGGRESTPDLPTTTLASRATPLEAGTDDGTSSTP